MLQINNELCTGCGQCIDMCSFAALSIKNGKAVVDHNLCRLCGVCMNACAVDAISITQPQQTVQSEGAPTDYAPRQISGFPGDWGTGGGRGRGMGRGAGGGVGRGRGRGMGGRRGR